MATFKFEVDDEMKKIISNIKKKINTGVYKINSFDKFIETSILVFSKLLDNKIRADQFEMFIDLQRIQSDNKKFDA